MRVPNRALVIALALVSIYPSIPVFAQRSDQLAAERVLGPQWRQLSRRAGLIFSGTVLSAPQTSVLSNRIAQGAAPTVELNFRVDEAIVGVERGQILKVREWTGAWAMHRPIRSGERFLIFLYAPSRLGLTSPVGGSTGLIKLDATGQTASALQEPSAAILRTGSSSYARVSGQPAIVSIIQLERAIRLARTE